MVLLLIHRDLTIDIDIITDMFARKHSRRMRIVISLLMRMVMVTRKGSQIASLDARKMYIKWV